MVVVVVVVVVVVFSVKQVDEGGAAAWHGLLQTFVLLLGSRWRPTEPVTPTGAI